MLKLTDDAYNWRNGCLTRAGSRQVKKIGYDWKCVFDDEVITVAELPTIRSGQKSYYGKAKIVTCKDETGALSFYLLSYETVVAMIRNDSFYRLWSGWSVTTANHINSFRAGFGLPKINKKDWLNLPCYVYNSEEHTFE